MIDPDGPGAASPFALAQPDFNVRSLRANTVFRWEFRPGSTFFVVWTQQRRDLDGTGASISPATPAASSAPRPTTCCW